MTIGELVEQLKTMNPNLLIKSLNIIRDDAGEHATYALETMPSPEPIQKASE